MVFSSARRARLAAQREEYEYVTPPGPVAEGMHRAGVARNRGHARRGAEEEGVERSRPSVAEQRKQNERTVSMWGGLHWPCV